MQTTNATANPFPICAAFDASLVNIDLIVEYGTGEQCRTLLDAIADEMHENGFKSYDEMALELVNATETLDTVKEELDTTKEELESEKTNHDQWRTMAFNMGELLREILESDKDVPDAMIKKLVDDYDKLS